MIFASHVEIAKGAKWIFAHESLFGGFDGAADALPTLAVMRAKKCEIFSGFQISKSDH